MDRRESRRESENVKEWGEWRETKWAVVGGTLEVAIAALASCQVTERVRETVPSVDYGRMEERFRGREEVDCLLHCYS